MPILGFEPDEYEEIIMRIDNKKTIFILHDKICSDENIIQLTNYLGINSNIYDLRINYSIISNNGWKILLNFLKENKNICKLRLVLPFISEKKWQFIFENLSLNKNIKELGIFDNIPYKSWYSLSMLLLQNNYIKKLNLCDISIPMYGWKYLIYIFNINNYTNLVLSDNNHIKKNNMRYIMYTIFKKTNLQKLYLFDNKIDKECFNYLKYSTLKKIYISDCNITEKCFIKLMTILKTNKNLKAFYLYGNNIKMSNETLKALYFLNKNETLEILSLDDCITEHCWPIISQFLKENRYLRILDLTGIPIKESDFDLLIDALEINSSLIRLIISDETNPKYMKIKYLLKINKNPRQYKTQFEMKLRNYKFYKKVINIY